VSSNRDLFFASGNSHKIAEVQQLIGSLYVVKSLKDLGVDIEIPETGDTLEANSLIKARFLNDTFHVNSFADDTGLEVEALDGAPGVYSARYAGLEKDSQANCSKLLQELKENEPRTARFRTVICLIRETAVHYFEGTISGTIVQQPRGAQGFGYDPVFQPLGHIRTFAQMSSQQKNRMSHRGKAVGKLVDFLGPEL